jgi:hypothetical protein
LILILKKFELPYRRNVMKRFILPLLILLFVGSLFAVESAPSEVVGYVKYDLVAGNNTIALPMDQPYAMAGDVGNAIGASAVGYYNTATQLWTIANKNFLGNWIGNFAVSNGQALWVTIAEATTFYSIGDLPDTEPVYNLVSGNNTVMVPLSSSDLSTSALVGNSITGASAVGYYNSTTQLWTISNKNFLGNWIGSFDTTIGSPLWITTNTAGTWPGAASRETPASLRTSK